LHGELRRQLIRVRLVVRGEFFLDPHQPFVQQRRRTRVSGAGNDPDDTRLALLRDHKIGHGNNEQRAPITGIDRRPLNKAGMDIRKNSSLFTGQRALI